MKNVLMVAAVLMLLLSAMPLRADEAGQGGEWQMKQNAQPVLTPGSDASFDKRLPPVFPGEEVSDGKKTMKVWSSSGPVPVAEPPEPWRGARQEDLNSMGGVGVIVDQRKDERR